MFRVCHLNHFCIRPWIKSNHLPYFFLKQSLTSTNKHKFQDNDEFQVRMKSPFVLYRCLLIGAHSSTVAIFTIHYLPRPVVLTLSMSQKVFLTHEPMIGFSAINLESPFMQMKHGISLLAFNWRLLFDRTSVFGVVPENGIIHGYSNFAGSVSEIVIDLFA